MTNPSPRSRPPTDAPTLRTGAVATLAGMPVATLRIWEQRYQAVRPATAPSGHRRYTPADVRRVVLLRQLTAAGHAIGSIAGLPDAALQALAGERPEAGVERDPVHRPVRLVVVGQALAARLRRPALAALGAPALDVVGVFTALADAARATADGADLLVWQAPELPTEVPPKLEAARAAWQARRIAVVHRFAAAAARDAFAATGAIVVREPADDASLAAWLASVLAPGADRAGVARSPAPRRYDDTVLTTIAGRSAGMACECPRHVAELLMQLGSFETYSAGCIDRSPADADLHAHLRWVAGTARALFESALERVARHEGFALP